MATKSISRRDILKTLTMGAMAGSVLRVIPAQAAEYAHHMVAAEKAATAAGAYAPKFFDLLTSENPKYQLKLGGGLMWLDAECTDRYGKPYLDCFSEQQKEIL